MTAFRISPEGGPSLPFGRPRRAPLWSARALALALGVVLVAGCVTTARAQTSSCSGGTAPEQSGPTDINAVSGNRGLTAAFNGKGTMTVLKWPSPSFYDQLDYRTTDRSAPRMGAEPNDGAFLGLAWKRAAKKSKWRFSWLRGWKTTQRFADADTDEIITMHRNRKAGLRVTVRDVVAADLDALIRAVKITRTASSPARAIRLFSFANFNPVFSKSAGSPNDDWCTDDASDEGATYLKGPDAIVHGAQGVDTSTGDPSGVTLVMGFSGSSAGHAVGADPSDSAYEDAHDASLANNTTRTTQSDAALFDAIKLARKRQATTNVIIAAGRSEPTALNALKTARSRGPGKIRRTKSGWWRRWLKVSPLPHRAPTSVVRLAKRSLISLRQAIDKKGLIVTSVATQSPLGLDWIRKGAYMNAALLAARHPNEVKRHNLAYADLQVGLGASPTPRGNWPTSMYADGVPGSSTPYEIDGTGLGLWTLWNAYSQTHDINYLAEAYEPAIRAAADYLTNTCVDAATDLQCLAHEEGSSDLRRTLVGAQAAWAGLDAAVAAAKVAMRRFGHSAAKRDAWRARRNELRAAIKEQFFDPACSCYTRDASTGGTMLWPVRLFPRGSKASDRQAVLNWRVVNKAVKGEVKHGGMEARAILGNAHAWAKRPRKLAKLKRALKWMAARRVTPGTSLLGGAWKVDKGEVHIMRSQPHAWHHAMFYLAALKTYGKSDYRF